MSVDNQRLLIVMMTMMVLLFMAEAYIAGTNLRTLKETCGEAR